MNNAVKLYICGFFCVISGEKMLKVPADLKR
jgi:hypothetical protein